LEQKSRIRNETRYVIEGKIMMNGITYLSKDGRRIISSFCKSKNFKVMCISLVSNISKANRKSKIPEVKYVQIEGRDITASLVLD